MGKIVFIGGGNMAGCLIGGMVAHGFPAQHILVSEPGEIARRQLEDQYAIATTTDNLTAVAEAELVILAVKPQILATVATDLAPGLCHQPTIVSIAAGIPVAALKKYLGNQLPLVRAMPNTPAMVQHGATGLFASQSLEPRQKEIIEKIFNAVGYTCWVDKEALIDAVTAVSGSGPAYFFLVFEAMQQIGQELGLTEQVAEQLTLHTALGAARMALESEARPAQLREQVTSPGGTTQAAVERFQQLALQDVFRQAMRSALDRAEEMSKDFAL